MIHIDSKPARESAPVVKRFDPRSPRGADGTAQSRVVETGGPQGPEPTRYGDWEKKGRCIDF